MLEVAPKWRLEEPLVVKGFSLKPLLYYTVFFRKKGEAKAKAGAREKERLHFNGNNNLHLLSAFAWFRRFSSQL